MLLSCVSARCAFVAILCKACWEIGVRQLGFMKKDSACLLQEFQVHAQWAASNLDLLRSRSGGGFKGKLRQWQSAEEQRIYSWLYKHARDLDPASILAQQLATVDAPEEDVLGTLVVAYFRNGMASADPH